MTRHRLLRRALPAGAAALTTLLIAAGCSSGSNPHGMPGMGASTVPNASSALPAGVNYADVMFAQQMVPHHQQAVAMAELAATRAADVELKQLAAQIKTAQDPEITLLTGWLADWGQPATATATAMPGMEMSASMPGMMSEEDLGKLSAASGTDFDRMFARMMIAHHNGAIEMATTEQNNGANAAAKTLAAQIVNTQQNEVTTMQRILDRL